MAQLAANTETEVANRALSHIKKPGITSLEDDRGHTADTLRLHFAPVRDALQRQYPWNFCKERASLPALAETPAFDWALYYQLPQDCLAVRAVNGVNDDDWEIVAGNRLATNAAAPINVTYTKRVTEVPYWDALFRIAFAMELAVAIAPELATDETILNEVQSKAEALLLQAFPSDAAESGEQKIEDTDWVTGR